MQQAVEHRATPVACSRVHNQAGRLVDDEQRVVFVDDVQVDWLGHEGVLIGRALWHDLDASAAGYRRARAHRRAIHAHGTGVDPLLQAAARVIGQELGQRLIQALSVQNFRNLHDDRLSRLCAADGRQIECLIIERVFGFLRSDGNVSRCVV